MNNLAAKPRLTLLVVLAVLLAWRFLAARDAALNLSIDEAQYFLWSLEPAWGYFSKPPLIAWAIALSTQLCGDSESCVRLPALLLFAGSSWVIAMLTTRLFDARTGLWAGIAFATLFLTSFYSWFMTTDALLLFFWALSLLLFVRVLETDSWRDWLALSASIGFGLLAKYSMGLFLACALAVLWLDHRERLASAKPWLAAFLALAFLIPNIFWNLDHQFATLRHTAEISQLDRKLFHPDSLLYFALAQFGVMGLLFPALLLAFVDRQSWQLDPNQRLLVLFSLPVLLLFFLLSLLSRANANWAAPAYVAASILAVTLLLRRQHPGWLIWAVIINLLLAASLYHWNRLGPALGITLKRGSDPFYPLHGWNSAGKQIGDRLRNAGCRTVITSERKTLVELAYYARRSLGEPVNAFAYNPEGIINNHFALTADIANRSFDCAVLVGGFDVSLLNKEFAAVEPLQAIEVPHWGRMEPVSTWRVSGFRGYVSSGR